MNPLKTVSSLLCTLAVLTAPLPALAKMTAEAGAEASETVETVQADPASLNLAKQIVAIGYPEETREALFFGTMDLTIVQMRQSLGDFLPSDDPAAIAIFDEWIGKYTAESKEILRKHIPTIMDGMTTAYAELFSQKELRDILTFVQTPSGKQFFGRMPEVINSASFTSANQAYMDESMASMIPAQRDLIKQLKEHQESKEDPAETT